MKPLVIVAVVLLYVCCQVAGQTLYYDPALLSRYARVSQQIRREFIKRIANVHERIAHLQQRLADISHDIQSSQASALTVIGEELIRFDDNSKLAGRFPAASVLVTPPSSYTDKYAPLLTEVELDYSLGFNGAESSLTIIRSGVYIIEYKMQGGEFRGYYHDVDIYGYDGSNKYYFHFWTDWEVSPHFQLVKLDAGDQVVGHSLGDSYSWGSATYVATGATAKTWLILRYLGEATGSTTW